MNIRIPTTITVSLVLMAASAASFQSCAKTGDPGELVVYTYDSFASEWGPAPKLAPLFEKATGLRVRFVSYGDAGLLLSKLVSEKKAPGADVVVGLDGNLLPGAIEAGVLDAYRPQGHEAIPEVLVMDRQWRLTPFDYGYFAIIWDSERLAVPPTSLDDLAKPEFARKLILMDPRTSTPGLGFLAWTMAAYGEGYGDFWRRLKPSILAMTPGWDTGYGLFTSGEAPLVVSYTTSPAYHAEFEKAGRYRALLFAEGHVAQIEGAGIVKGTKRRKAAERFIDFLLSETAQRELPLTQWMYPVLPGTALPASFDWAPKPRATLPSDPGGLAAASDAVTDILAAR